MLLLGGDFTGVETTCSGLAALLRNVHALSGTTATTVSTSPGNIPRARRTSLLPQPAVRPAQRLAQPAIHPLRRRAAVGRRSTATTITTRTCSGASAQTTIARDCLNYGTDFKPLINKYAWRTHYDPVSLAPYRSGKMGATDSSPMTTPSPPITACGRPTRSAGSGHVHLGIGRRLRQTFTGFARRAFRATVPPAK